MHRYLSCDQQVCVLMDVLSQSVCWAELFWDQDQPSPHNTELKIEALYAPSATHPISDVNDSLRQQCKCIREPAAPEEHSPTCTAWLPREACIHTRVEMSHS